MLRFDPGQTPTTPRDAATVVVIRQALPDSVEIFCVKRHQASGFLGGAVVFPGGKLAEADTVSEWKELTTPLGTRALSVAPDEDRARAFAVAALRELFEEAQILLTAGADLDDAATRALRRELSSPGAPEIDPTRFRVLLAERGLRLDAARLEALSRWVTPAAETRRYDTRFYLAAAPRAQTGAHDEHETTSSFWATPGVIVAMWERGEIFLAPPTLRTVQLFAEARTIDECVAVARSQSLEPVCPHFVMHGDDAILTLPGDALYPEACPPPADASAPTRFVLCDGRFVPERHLPSR